MNLKLLRLDVSVFDETATAKAGAHWDNLASLAKEMRDLPPKLADTYQARARHKRQI